MEEEVVIESAVVDCVVRLEALTEVLPIEVANEDVKGLVEVELKVLLLRIVGLPVEVGRSDVEEMSVVLLVCDIVLLEMLSVGSPDVEVANAIVPLTASEEEKVAKVLVGSLMDNDVEVVNTSDEVLLIMEDVGSKVAVVKVLFGA